MKSVQDTLNAELAKGKSIAWWAIGYYISYGGEHGFDLKIPIFQFNEADNNTRVLIDYLGTMMWINIRPSQLHYGWGGEDAPSPEAKEIRRKLEELV